MISDQGNYVGKGLWIVGFPFLCPRRVRLTPDYLFSHYTKIIRSDVPSNTSYILNFVRSDLTG